MKTQGHSLFIVLSIFITCFVINSVYGQILQPNRFEEEFKHSDHHFNIISLADEGLILIREAGNFEDGKKLWDITHLDSSLTKVWSDKLRLDPALDLAGYEYIRGQLHLLFRKGETGSGNFSLLHFSLATHVYDQYDIKHQFEFRLTHFSVAGSTLVFGGYAVKEPTILLFSITDRQLKVVPGFLLHDTELLDVRVNRNNTFNVLMAERGLKDGKKLILRTYDETGVLLLEDDLVMDNDKTPLSGITSVLLKDEMFIVGTYGTGVSKQAQGFYSAMIDPYSDQPIRYTDLAQLQHFLDFLGEKKALKVKQNAEKQRQQGKTPTFKNSVALIRIHETTKGFLLLAEAYYSSMNLNSTSYWNNYPYNYGYGRPGYGYSPYGYNNPYGNRYYNTPYSRQPNQNSEVKMTEGVMIMFDNQAKPDWDESFEFNNVKYSSLEQTSDFIETPKGILIAYKKNNELYTKLSIPHDDHALMDTTKIKLLDEAELFKDESDQDGAVKHWFENNFYTWGYHTIKNKSKQSADPTRNVFYINKVSTE